MPSRNLPATPDARLPKIPLLDISFEHLAPDHDLLPFSCRQQELNDYLTADALKNQDAHVAVTYLALYDGKCVGYFSLLNDSIIKKDIDPEDDKDWYAHSYYPAIKIARFATHQDYEGRDIGRAMLTAIRSIATEVAKHSGCCVLTVDAKPDAEPFYERFGFHRTLKTKKKNTIPMYRCNIF
ncbi:MAG: GNAT family N-acetyltransferase [Methanoculleus sp.]|jgi:GNAT superfamily N-acetyltransferase|nr:GNAT family N-acetyltransferase [Methanoculleus sp.]MCK9306898.1 GNAT family N-acetyltransferase [Methanoculleus sp.]